MTQQQQQQGKVWTLCGESSLALQAVVTAWWSVFEEKIFHGTVGQGGQCLATAWHVLRPPAFNVDGTLLKKHHRATSALTDVGEGEDEKLQSAVPTCEQVVSAAVSASSQITTASNVLQLTPTSDPQLQRTLSIWNMGPAGEVKLQYASKQVIEPTSAGNVRLEINAQGGLEICLYAESWWLRLLATALLPMTVMSAPATAASAGDSKSSNSSPEVDSWTADGWKGDAKLVLVRWPPESRVKMLSDTACVNSLQLAIQLAHATIRSIEEQDMTIWGIRIHRPKE